MRKWPRLIVYDVDKIVPVKQLNISFEETGHVKKSQIAEKMEKQK